MKKILFAIAIVLTISLTANAQGKNDNFFNDWDTDWNRTSGTTPSVPWEAVGINNNIQSDPLPLGSGLIILSALGAGYAVARKRSKK